ncbi:putative cyclin-D1-1-like [Capsicum annuum]|nr:putative cyclin-D1-1-like [Capsicum annuum]
MLSLASYTRQPQCCNINYIPSSQLLSKIPPTHWFFHSNKLTHATIPSLLWQKRTGLSLSALKNEVEVEEIDNLDDDDDVDVDDFIGDEDDDDEVIMPLRNMKKWLEHKPKGFGVDKVYDTAVEDKLMEEIEQSRKAQLANINKLKNNPVNASAKNVQQDKVVQDGLRVRLVNLPKKMNINKDLRVAFKGVSGIANIVPVVTGNKKTRNPICKGLAYIDFKSKNEAQRFVQMFSGRSISFGKVQKQIKCEMINPGSHKSKTIQSVDEIKYAPEQEKPDLHGDQDDDFDADFLSDSEENIFIDDDVPEVDDLSADTDDYVENSETLCAESTSGDEQDVREETESSEQKKVEAKEKKKQKKPKQKKEMVSKLNVPGSARKLKIKDKAVLTGVLSKYAQKIPS